MSEKAANEAVAPGKPGGGREFQVLKKIEEHLNANQPDEALQTVKGVPVSSPKQSDVGHGFVDVDQGIFQTTLLKVENHLKQGEQDKALAVVRDALAKFTGGNELPPRSTTA